MPFKHCPTCNRQFVKTEHLKRHVRTHTKERPYKCSICHKCFARSLPSDVLRRHEKNHPRRVLHRVETEEAMPDSPSSNSSDSNQNSHSPSPPIEVQCDDSMAILPQPLVDTEIQHSLGDMTLPDCLWNFQMSPQASSINPPFSLEPNMTQTFDPIEVNLDTLLFPALHDIQHERSNTGIVPASPESSQSSAGVQSFTCNDNIPDHRFHQVEDYWLTPTSDSCRSSYSSIWELVKTTERTNIFSLEQLDSSSIPSRELSCRRSLLDEHCRQRMTTMIRKISSSASIHSTVDMVSVELLDLAMDLYFRKYHPLQSFIHLATFCPCATTPSLLWAMCLIGMMVIGTKGATLLATSTLTALIEDTLSKLSTLLEVDSSDLDMLSVLGTSLLVIHLVTMVDVSASLQSCIIIAFAESLLRVIQERNHFRESRLIYKKAIIVAERAGLFTVSQRHEIDMTISAELENDHRWQAWSRVESLKRLAVGLIRLDSWFSSFYTKPMLSLTSMRVALPCDDVVFNAFSSSRWSQLIDGEKKQEPFSVGLDDIADLGLLKTHHDCTRMSGIMAICLLALHGAAGRFPAAHLTHTIFYQVITNEDPGDEFSRIFANHIMNSSGSSHQQDNVNCTMMKHGICMALMADIKLFEVAAGRSGPGPAKPALESIAAWSRLPSARRACLHAVQIFQCASDKCSSEQLDYHSLAALFKAALVLGLYVFMASPPENDSNTVSIEIRDSIDWSKVENENPVLLKNQEKSDYRELCGCDPLDFIRHGGILFVYGQRREPGYESSRRILLEFAALIEAVGGPCQQRFSHILYIMTDVLLE